MTRPTGTTPSTKGPAVTLDVYEGYFKTRLTKGGVMVPAQVVLVDGPRDEAGELIGDQKFVGHVWDEAGPREVDLYDDPKGWWSYLCGNEIEKDEFDRMVAVMDWARNSTAPEGAPSTAIDYLKVGAIF